MIRIFFIILALLPIFVKAQISDTIHLSLSDISICKTGIYDKVQANCTNYTTEQVGAPEIPIVLKYYVIPSNAKVVNFKQSNTEKCIIANKITPYPIQQPVPDNMIDSVKFTQPNHAVYWGTNNYPNIRAELVADYYEMGYHLVCIRSYPIEWNPINKQLKLYDISYSLNYTLSNEYETNNSSISQYRANVIRDLIKAKVSNPQDIDKTTILNSSNNNSTVSLISVNEVMENDVINNQKTDYIIVTNKELEPEFKRLANWKTKKGVPTIIKCVEDITNEYHGTDLQEKIHAYLKESKDKWGQGLFVLLGGDTNIIPARFYKSSNDEGGALCPSDAYFSDLDCDWNTNKNNQYGERIYDKLNFKRCNFIGRAAVEDIQEAKIFIDKVLGYEKLNSDMINVSYLTYIIHTLNLSVNSI